MVGRRIIQVVFFACFLFLLFVPVSWMSVSRSLIVAIDPSVAIGTTIASRSWNWLLFPGFIVLLSGVFIGRWFCGHACPMGTTLDFLGGLARLLRTGKHGSDVALYRPYRKVKYLILAGVIMAAVFGIGLVHWFSPMPLVTRLYSTIVHAAATSLGESGLDWIRNALAHFDWYVFENAFIDSRHYSGTFFIAGFFIALTVSEYFVPRFWCRFICPAGAALGLASFSPVFKRKASQCVTCGKCGEKCPTSAIVDGGAGTNYRECLTCGKCKSICPVGAVTFFTDGKPADRGTSYMGSDTTKSGCTMPNRRQFLAAMAIGSSVAIVELSGLGRLNNTNGAGVANSPHYLRPPGAIPEDDFLNQCVRCGLCLRACPENALQSAGIGEGLMALSTPILRPRIGACAPSCTACGQVCPTHAIRPLPMAEKQWAKIGTAVVSKNICQVWADGIHCGSCKYACPYDAIQLTDDQKPIVDANRCFGCGACEKVCPMATPAITVFRKGAVRLGNGSYVEFGKDAGLDLQPRQY